MGQLGHGLEPHGFRGPALSKAKARKLCQCTLYITIPEIPQLIPSKIRKIGSLQVQSKMISAKAIFSSGRNSAYLLLPPLI